ncbi:MAG TPA: heme exporter protein CcmB [Gemmatimonadaceae bacterium]|nr:heme exporter protein CcmB [Gemmatimonadaceae bacterium]
MPDVVWRRELGRVLAVARKDLAIERRSKATLNAVIFFAALTLLLFGFALGADTSAMRDAAAGVLWLTVLFSGVLVFNRSYQLELEAQSLESLLLYPGERRAIFLGKLLANLAIVFVVEVVTVPAAGILYQVPFWPHLIPLIGVLLLGSIGFVGLGTFYAAIASRVRSREVLLPLLLFPMLVPVLIAAVEATTAILAGDPMGNSGAWVRLLAAFDAIFLVAAFFAFEYVIGD